MVLARLAKVIQPPCLAEPSRCLQVEKNSQVIKIAVKPQNVATVLQEIKDILTDEHIIVSIAAGIPLSAMKVSQSPSCAVAAGVPVGSEGAPQDPSDSGA